MCVCACQEREAFRRNTTWLSFAKRCKKTGGSNSYYEFHPASSRGSVLSNATKQSLTDSEPGMFYKTLGTVVY